ncbi:MAG: aromatic amino acid transport family protein, partial [Candidatus Nanoarchaeia archaeon]|nr:aromatic amino acid transport family protein [Candidatus Nanoarchaeia archaeon]
MNKNTFYAITLLMGNIIGAGVLGIPYAVSKSGLIPGLLMLAGISVPMLMMYMYMGEITLRLKPVHQLAGMFKHYFKNNKILKNIAVISLFMS